MTPEEFKKFNRLSQEKQIELFTEARKNLKLSQAELGEKLEIYGYAGGRRTIQSWEHKKAKIPALVYELLISNFKDRPS